MIKNTATLYLRVPTELRERVDAYQASTRNTLNGAAIELIQAGLDAWESQRGGRHVSAADAEWLATRLNRPVQLPT